jgi:hypothetical protein
VPTTKVQTVTTVEFTRAEIAAMASARLGSLRAQDAIVDLQGNITFPAQGLDFAGAIQNLPAGYKVEFVRTLPGPLSRGTSDIAVRISWAVDAK